jgi:hypothetical protein
MRQWQLFAKPAVAATNLHKLLAMSVVQLGRAATLERAAGKTCSKYFIYPIHQTVGIPQEQGICRPLHNQKKQVCRLNV